MVNVQGNKINNIFSYLTGNYLNADFSSDQKIMKLQEKNLC